MPWDGFPENLLRALSARSSQSCLCIRCSLFLSRQGLLTLQVTSSVSRSHRTTQPPTSPSAFSTFPACGHRASEKGEIRCNGITTTHWEASHNARTFLLSWMFVHLVFYYALHTISGWQIAEDMNWAEAEKQSWSLFPPSPLPCLQLHKNECTSHFPLLFLSSCSSYHLEQGSGRGEGRKGRTGNDKLSLHYTSAVWKVKQNKIKKI